MNQLNNSYKNELEYIKEGNMYDIWTLNKDMTMASRNSINSNIKQEVPVTKEILEMIKKQEIAKKELEKFIATPENHTNILTQIHPLINKHLDYLDKNSMKQLSEKMITIGQSDQINIKISQYFSLFTEYINRKINGIRLDDESEELFESVVAKFQKDILEITKIEQHNIGKSPI